MGLVIGITAFCFLFVVWFIVCAVFTTACTNVAYDRDDVKVSDCKKDDASVDSAFDDDDDDNDDVGTPQSVLAHLHKSLNRSKSRPRTLFDEDD
eukprot:1129453-Prymnesium_polylepis.1